MNQTEENLYKKVKSDICRLIFEGTYQQGEQIPPERKLSEELGVSRVTVRKALKLLEEERIISRVQGSGTRVSMYYGARQGDMEIITLVASAQNEFFSRFLDAFQTEADKQNALVLFKQKPPKVSLEKCLYQIYEKGIRNIVLWPENLKLEEENFQVLRGLGLNMVLFDSVEGGSYADAVCLDNANAVKILHTRLRQEGCKRIGYVGWDAENIGSLRVREEEFLRLEPKGKIKNIPYRYHNCLHTLSKDIVHETLEFVRECDGLIYAVCELGITFEGYAKDRFAHKAGTIGVMQGGEELGLYMVEQDFEKMAGQIFRCLKQQNEGDSGWKAAGYLMRGKPQF